MTAVQTRNAASVRETASVRRTASDRLRVRRFDADRADREVTLEEALAGRPSDRQLLWIDVDGALTPDETEAIHKRFSLDEETRRALIEPLGEPHLAVHGAYLHVSVAAARSDQDESAAAWLDIVGARNLVITRHEGPAPLLDNIDERIKTDSTLGQEEGAEFMAVLLEAVVTGYFAAVDELEDAVDRLDSRSLRDDGRRDLLDDLVRLRHRISRLRRTIAGQRGIFAALSGPDVRQVVESPDAAADLAAVASRYESATGAVESSRESLLGSFDVYMTRTAQRTNDVMKILTIVTVLLLPGSMIAGLLGMNVVVPLNKDDPVSFWLVIGGVGLLAVVIMGLARLRRWI